MMTRRCPQCDRVLLVEEFLRKKSGRQKGQLQGYCRDCRRHNQRKYRVDNPERWREYFRKDNLKKFGLTLEEYDNMLKRQNDGCAICGKRCSTGNRLAVDHDHVTGRVRGLLCSKHNKALGSFSDNADLLRAAIRYLSVNPK